MLANLRRRLGLGAAAVAPVPLAPPAELLAPAPPLTMEELGFTAWPADRGAFNPSAIPAWLQEQVRAL
jgi:hypothetical protein